METIFIVIVIVIIGGLYLLPAVIPSLLIYYLGRERAQFMWWELSAFVLPFIAWLVFALCSKDKGLWSPMVESFILGCTVSVAALIRVIVGRAVNRNLIAGSLIFVICVEAILLGIMVPKIEFQPFVK